MAAVGDRAPESTEPHKREAPHASGRPSAFARDVEVTRGLLSELVGIGERPRSRSFAVRPPPAPEGGRRRWVAAALDDSAIGTSLSERLPPGPGGSTRDRGDGEKPEADEEIVRVHSGSRKGTSAFERDLAAFRELLGEGRRVIRKRLEGSEGHSRKEVLVAPPPEQQLRRSASDGRVVVLPPPSSTSSSAFARDVRAMQDMFTGPSKPRDPAKEAGAAAGGGGGDGVPVPPESGRHETGADEGVVIHRAAGRSAFERDVVAVQELFSAQKVRVGSSADVERKRSSSIGARPPPPGSAKAVITRTAVRKAPPPSHRLSNSSWPIVRDFWAMVDGFRTMFD